MRNNPELNFYMV